MTRPPPGSSLPCGTTWRPATARRSSRRSRSSSPPGRGSTTTSRCCWRRSAIPPTEGVRGMPQEPPQVTLGPAQFGKAEVRVLHVDRATPRHEITDLNVTITLAGDMAGTYLTGDNSGVLTTDAQKNTVYAFARSGVRPVEEFALRLGRHFAQVGSVHRAQVRIEEYGWRRIDTDGGPHPHSFERLAGTRSVSACGFDDGRAEGAG